MTPSSVTGAHERAARLSPREGILFARAIDVVLAIVAVITGVALAGLLLGTRFRQYDDEGYALISLAQFLRSGRLYRDVYSQYGPFFFATGEFCFRILGIPLNHDGGRLVTFLSWMVASLLGGRIVQLSTKRLLLGAAASGCLFVIGSVLSNEPMHPQFIVLALSAVAIYLSFSQRQSGAVFGLGVVGALLLLTKVNIGAFYTIALLQTMVVLVRKSRLRTAILCITVSFTSVLPYLLMRTHMATSGRYCMLATVCIASVSVIGSRLRCRTPFSVPKLWLCAGGGIFTAALVIGFTVLRGSSSVDLINGVILWNARLPDVFSAVPYPSKLVTLLALVFPVASVLLCLWINSERRRLARFEAPLGALCFAAGLMAVGLSLSRLEVAGLALVPLGFIPILIRQDFPLSAVFGRLFVMNWCVIGFLQIWPVAGSQRWIATLPLLIWAFISMGDGLEGFCRSLGHIAGKLIKSTNPQHALERWPTPAALTRAAAVAAILCSAYAATAKRSDVEDGSAVWEFITYPASHLNGAHFLHLAPDRELTYGFLVASVKRNCDVLFTLPGMASFNFWSDVPPPNGWNLTAWMKGLDSGRQQRILEILLAHPRSCVIQNSDLIRFWQTTEAQVRALPLGRFILQRMPAVAEQNGYVIRVHPERNTPWIPVASSY
jgi:hypothetical protein